MAVDLDDKQENTTIKIALVYFLEFLGYVVLGMVYIFVFKDLLFLFVDTVKLFPHLKLIKISATKQFTAPIIYFGPLPSLLFTPPLKMLFSLVTLRSTSTAWSVLIDEYGLILSDVKSVIMWPFLWYIIEP